MQASHRGEESAETQIHPGFQAIVGVAVEGVVSVASRGAADAACDGQEMAHPSLPSILALEVEGAAWPTSHSEEDAGFDSPAKPRESLVERWTNQGYTAIGWL